MSKSGVDFTNRLDALVQALVLSVTAPTDEKSQKALALASQIAQPMNTMDIQRARNIAEDLLTASTALQQARDGLADAKKTARRSAVKAVEAGATEVKVANVLGINRTTLRKWLGK